MRKSMLLMLVGICLCAAWTAYAADQASMPVFSAPKIEEKAGDTDVYIGPAYFPRFIALGDNDNTACEKNLFELTKDKTKPVSVCDSRIGDAYGIKDMFHPLCCCFTQGQVGNFTVDEKTGAVVLKPGSCETACKNAATTANANPADACKASRCAGKSQVGQFVTVPGLVIENYKIDAQYRKTAKILVSWTVRIESAPYVVEYWPYLCKPYHGRYKYEFDAGSARTQLYIDGKPVGEKFSMEVPGGVQAGKFRSDPVITGHFFISPEQYPNGELPATIGKLEIRWQNETSMLLTSPKNMRNIVLQVMPVGGNRADKVEAAN